MGLFNKIIGKLTEKPKTVQEILAEDHPTEWYESNTSKVFIKVFIEFNEEGVDAAINLYCLKYFESFDNIKKLREEGFRVDTTILGKEFACYLQKIIADSTETGMKTFLIGQAFKNTNSYIRFIKKLNHNFYGQTAFIISELIFMDYIKVDNMEWLFDEELFTCDKIEDEEKDWLFEKISPVLMEKGLLSEEIIEEIKENMQ